MNKEDLCFTPATRLIPMLRSKQLSPVELVDTVLERIEALEPKLNAIVTLTADSARKAAKAAEAALMRGAGGPLAGVPVTIKDLSPVAGVPQKSGSYIREHYVPDVTAPFVDRLRGAGAVVLGKTATSEFGWTGVSRSPLTGITSNPWKLGYNTGASSAGAGAGAAAGYGPLHQGSDGAGSIRMPSHFSGVFGLKPTFGRIANWPVRNNDQISHIGPMTRTVGDAALMLKVMAGPHPWDHYCLDAAPADYPALLEGGVKGLKVAYSPDLGHARVDKEVADLVAKAVKAFEELGAHVEEVKVPFPADGPEVVRFLWSAHELELAPFLPEYESRMDPGLVACIKDSVDTMASEYLAKRVRKLAYIEKVHQFFDGWDLLLTPSVSVAAFPAERLQPEGWPQHPWDWLMWAEFSWPFNFSGNPAASIPCGFTAQGLPVGLQIVGKRLDDVGVLRAARAFETARPWADKRPPL
jgi:aspartyl-tRNA(Asn)/glutamyl-tRNA(Gln) amidotransferase subunit A